MEERAREALQDYYEEHYAQYDDVVEWYTDFVTDEHYTWRFVIHGRHIFLRYDYFTEEVEEDEA